MWMAITSINRTWLCHHLHRVDRAKTCPGTKHDGNLFRVENCLFEIISNLTVNVYIHTRPSICRMGIFCFGPSMKTETRNEKMTSCDFLFFFFLFVLLRATTCLVAKSARLISHDDDGSNVFPWREEKNGLHGSPLASHRLLL